MKHQHDRLAVRVYTHNVRYATAAPFTGEEVWDVRAPRSIAEARYHTRGIAGALICLQEVLHMQLVEVLKGLNQRPGSNENVEPEWAYVGVGRDDGHRRGEYSPIFYRPSVYHLQYWETVWLSPTPTEPSKGWDAGSVRILTVAVLLHRQSGKTLLVLNTHLDDRGSTAREKGAQIILATINKYLSAHQKAQKDPAVDKLQSGLSRPRFTGKVDAVVLAGDLNSQEHQEAYQTLTNPLSPLEDVHRLVPGLDRYGNSDTFTGFSSHDEHSRIDYVLTGPRTHPTEKAQEDHDHEKNAPVLQHTSGPWEVHGYAVLPNRFDDAVFNSDHRAVVVDLEL